MGRGERWRAMSGKVMDAVHCITQCSSICFITPIAVGAVGYRRAFFILSPNVPKLTFTSCKFDIL